MRKLLIVCMFVIGLSAAEAFAMAGVAADAAVPEPDMSAYPAAGCTNVGTFPGERKVVRLPVNEGFLVCHVWVYAMNKQWQFSEDGRRVVDGFGRELRVTGIGTREVWITTDGSFSFSNFAVFAWSPVWLPNVWSYP